jgi:hypothetical protein
VPPLEAETMPPPGTELPPPGRTGLGLTELARRRQNDSRGGGLPARGKAGRPTAGLVGPGEPRRENPPAAGKNPAAVIRRTAKMKPQQNQSRILGPT